MTESAQKLAGKFIVLDGPDGSGKSTQMKMLAEYISAMGVQVITTRDPGGTAIGDKIRQILLDRDNSEMSIACEIQLYMASRTQLMNEVIAPALRENKCVLCDRWVSSTVAYQVAEGKSTANEIMALYRLALKDVGPDLTLILDIDSETGLARAEGDAGHDRIEAKGLQFHQKVRELFLSQANANPKSFAIINATGNIETVHEKIVQTIESRYSQTNP